MPLLLKLVGQGARVGASVQCVLCAGCQLRHSMQPCSSYAMFAQPRPAHPSQGLTGGRPPRCHAACACACVREWHRLRHRLGVGTMTNAVARVLPAAAVKPAPPLALACGVASVHALRPCAAVQGARSFPEPCPPWLGLL